jgi:hypothetical protein
MTSRLVFAVHYLALLTLFTFTCFTPHSNDVTSWQNSSAEKISCNVMPFFYHHSVVIQHIVSDRLLSLNSKENCGHKRMVHNYFVMTSYHWNVRENSKTWCKGLYQHTMYVISVSNISIKTNLKQIKIVEIILTNVYNTLRDTTFCAWRHIIYCHSFFCFAYVAYIDVFSPHSNDMTSWQNSSAEKISCNVTPLFYHQV